MSDIVSIVKSDATPIPHAQAATDAWLAMIEALAVDRVPRRHKRKRRRK